MRELGFEVCKKYLTVFGVDLNTKAIDVGGAPRVVYKGIKQRNPLLELHPDLEFLDEGFLDGATYRMDFLDPDLIEPLKDKFGLVYCFYTLEHVRDPGRWCKHLMYITAPGGHVYLSTVFQAPYHPSPKDYWRFTPDALGLLFKDRNILWKGWEDKKGVAILVRKEI